MVFAHLALGLTVERGLDDGFGEDEEFLGGLAMMMVEGSRVDDDDDDMRVTDGACRSPVPMMCPIRMGRIGLVLSALDATLMGGCRSTYVRSAAWGGTIGDGRGC